jgi:hypothetical protein
MTHLPETSPACQQPAKHTAARTNQSGRLLSLLRHGLDRAEAEVLIDQLDPAEAWAVRRGIAAVMNGDED